MWRHLWGYEPVTQWQDDDTPSFVVEVEFYTHWNSTVDFVMLLLLPSPPWFYQLPNPYISHNHGILHTSAFDQDMQFTEKKKLIELPRTMGFLGLPVLHYLEAAGLLEFLMAFWRPNYGVIWETVSWEGELQPHGNFTLSKNHHSLVLLHPQPERTLRFRN